MAGDRRISVGETECYKSEIPKISKTWNNILIGASGDSAICELIVNVFEPPKIESDIQTYMYFIFLPQFIKLLKSQSGFSDEHKNLRIAVDEECSALIGIKGQVYLLEIFNPEKDVKESSLGRAVLTVAPTPYAIGCGDIPALSLLTEEKKRLGHNTKERLSLAMEISSQLSTGCDNEIDYRQE